MDCTPASLSKAAACLTCIPSGQRWSVIAYLLCEWAKKKVVVDCGTPSDFIIITGAGDAAANQQYNFVNLIIGYQGQTDSAFTIKQDLNGNWWIYQNMVNLYTSLAADFPCVWTLDGGAGTGPAPIGAWSITACGNPTNTIQISGAGIGGSNQTYTWNATLSEYIGNVDSSYIIVNNGIGWELDQGSNPLYGASFQGFPCAWGNQPDIVGPSPTGQYI